MMFNVMKFHQFMKLDNCGHGLYEIEMVRNGSSIGQLKCDCIVNNDAWEVPENRWWWTRIDKNDWSVTAWRRVRTIGISMCPRHNIGMQLWINFARWWLIIQRASYHDKCSVQHCRPYLAIVTVFGHHWFILVTHWLTKKTENHGFNTSVLPTWLWRWFPEMSEWVDWCISIRNASMNKQLGRCSTGMYTIDN